MAQPKKNHPALQTGISISFLAQKHSRAPQKPLIIILASLSFFLLSSHTCFARSPKSGKLDYKLVEFNSIYFLDVNTGFAVARRGIILKTTDGGKTWARRDSGTTSGLNAIVFTTETTGYSAGTRGTIIKTTDGGETWHKVKSGTTNALNSVAFTNPSTGIIVGENGTILRTTDVGETWMPVKKASDNWLSAVQFVDGATAFASGWYGTMLKTIDAGETWSRLNTYTGKWLKTISFPDPLTGYGAGEGGYIIKTSDGGASWTLFKPRVHELINGISFPTSKAGCAAVIMGKIVCTADGGDSWNESLAMKEVSRLSSIFFVNEKTGYATGDRCDIYKTADGGGSWRLLSTANVCAEIQPDTGIATVESYDPYENAVYEHANDPDIPVFLESGATAENAADGKLIAFKLSLSFVNYGAFSHKPAISGAWAFVTADSGRTWTKVPLEQKPVLDSDSFYMSKNNGKTWIRKSHGASRGYPTYKYFEDWEGRLNPASLSAAPGATVTYFFRVEDNFGNVTTELPATSPGWPPNPAAFFTGVADTDKGEKPLSQSLDITDSFMAADGANLYLAFRTKGNIAPLDPASQTMFAYAASFTDPASNAMPGNVAEFFGDPPGESMLAFAPIYYYPFQRADLSLDAPGGSTGRSMDGCRNFVPSDLSRIKVAAGNNTIFFQKPLADICAGDCLGARILFSASAGKVLPTYYTFGYPNDMSIDNTPYLMVYFRSHQLDGAQAVPVAAGDSAYASTPIETPTMFVPALDSAVTQDTFGGPAIPELSALERKNYEDWLNLTAGATATLQTPFLDQVYSGPGPFRVSPCNIIYYKNYYFEVYERNDRIKLRIFRDHKWWHTIMIGPDTKPLRDEQHDTGDIYITLSDFDKYGPSCKFEIKESPKK